MIMSSNSNRNEESEEVYSSETGFDFSDQSLNVYAVLSGSRVSQMTKTFEDVDALQNLLEEVRDLLIYLLPNYNLKIR